MLFWLRFTLLVVLATYLSACASVAPNPLRAVTPQLQQTINRAAPAIELAALFVDPQTGDVLFEHSADASFAPASTLKLFTLAAALDQLGPAFRFKTEVWATGYSGASVDDLYLVGGGDPSLSGADIAALAQELHRMGLRRIKGRVHVDGSLFDDDPYPQGWMREDLDKGFAAPISALCINSNRLSFSIRPNFKVHQPAYALLDPDTRLIHLDNHIKTGPKATPIAIMEQEPIAKGAYITLKGSVISNAPITYKSLPLRAPQLFAAQLFGEALAHAGIKQGRSPSTGTVPKGATRLTTHISSSLGEIVQDISKFSNNNATETLLKYLGHSATQMPGSFANGLSAVQDFMSKRAGISLERIEAFDGSGLSGYNQLTAKHLARLLSFAWHDFKIGPEFVAALPIWGLDGTLQKAPKRLKGVVRAKTGTLKHTSALAGFLELESGKIVAFVLLTKSTLPHAQRNALIEQLLALAAAR